MFIEDSFWHLFADKDMKWLSGKNFGTFFHSELQVKVVCVGNRAYPENANSNTCAPNTLKFHTFCGLSVTKQCFKFELDILNGSGVIAT